MHVLRRSRQIASHFSLEAAPGKKAIRDHNYRYLDELLFQRVEAQASKQTEDKAKIVDDTPMLSTSEQRLLSPHNHKPERNKPEFRLPLTGTKAPMDSMVHLLACVSLDPAATRPAPSLATQAQASKPAVPQILPLCFIEAANAEVYDTCRF